MNWLKRSACLLFVVTSVDADTNNVQVEIGGVKISVGAPVGFHEISNLSPETRELAENMTPPTNILLAVFVSEEDLGRILKGQNPTLQRYVLLQTVKEGTDQNFQVEHFRYLIDQVKETQNTLLESVKDQTNRFMLDASGKVSNQTGVPIDIQANEQVPLGVFFENANAIGFAMLARTREEVKGETTDYVFAAGSTTLLAKSKIMFAYVYGQFESQADIDWVRSISRTWVNEILNSNQEASDSRGSVDKGEDQFAISFPAYSQDLEQTKRDAEAGDAGSQYNLGIMYEKGRGVSQNSVEAAKWFRLAAEQEASQAQYNLGVMYGMGRGVPQDHAEAVKWFRLAAVQGLSQAQHNLGVAYDNGMGVPQDFAEAVKWFRLAAEQELSQAQYDLGIMYENGRGVPQDYAEAVKWYRLAAAQGHDKSQYNLGVMYAKGEGVPEDITEAEKLWRLAAAQGFAPAQTSLSLISDNGESAPRDLETLGRGLGVWLVVQFVVLFLPAVILRYFIFRGIVKKYAAIIYVIVTYIVWFGLQRALGSSHPYLAVTSAVLLYGSYQILRYEKKQIW